MKVGDLVRSPLWGVPGNRGVIMNKRAIHRTLAYEFFILWHDGGSSWVIENNLEVISESR